MSESEPYEPQPLPPLADTNLRLVPSPTAHSAYSLVRSAEEHFVAQRNDDAVMRARVLGFLMLAFADFRHVLGDGPLSRLARDAASSTQDTRGLAVERGTYYLEKLLRPFNRQTGRLPDLSEDPSRPPLHTLDDLTHEYMDASGGDYLSGKKRALARDGFRCMVTGHVDRATVLANRVLALGHRTRATTVCCHILPDSTTEGADPGNPDRALKRQDASSILAVLQEFGFQKIATEFSDVHRIHDPSNVMTMHHGLHSMFNSLSLWLEPTDIADQYKVCFAPWERGSAPAGVPDVVAFSVHPAAGAHGLPLPDRRLLAIHAACARAAQLSGAAEYMDRWEWDEDVTPHLAEDGSNAHMLVERISRVAILSS